ncbi:hypothetical protein ATEIFO6365_0002042100 [Aspergillus terreus]|uniref:Uncharacterized protein n=1 Tax=Aspergillus terreus TaxID=33178 RepID=A0A5M3YUE8_ASPTE|nr:hypothetical protein ATETN484_0004042100 [Aspergillus terreus]GFF13310.1 hypothetical protein ATEIFO6365_0002042100 [Aspergillus terreus]
MKSALLLCLAPTIALAVPAEQVPAAVAPSPSVPNITPPIPLPAVADDESHALPVDVRQMVPVLNPANAAGSVAEDPVATPVPDQWPAPLRGSIGLGSLRASTGMTKSLRARSEGTLGQTPWIGMAIGLTCTALAAVMLG